jgi:hypothetical protein
MFPQAKKPTNFVGFFAFHLIKCTGFFLKAILCDMNLSFLFPPGGGICLNASKSDKLLFPFE